MINLVGLMGAFMVLGGSIGFLTFPTSLKMGLKAMVNLDEEGMVFPKYMYPPIGPKSTFWLFAIKNPKELLQGKRASFELKGPYKFDVILMREQIQFSGDRERVSFDWSRQLIWDEANSSNPDEQMLLLNPILPSTFSTIKALVLDRIPFRRLSEPVVFNSLNVMLDAYEERLIMKTTPRILMDGRTVEMMDAAMGIAKRLGLGSLMPPGPPDNVFGMVYVQNRTIDNVELWTGTGRTRNKFAEVSKFKGKPRLETWRGQCNTISGTNGELYKPLLEFGKPIRIFLGPLCRSFDLDPVGTELVETESGAKALEYEFSRRLFQGVRNNRPKECFCRDTRTYDCQYDGLISMGPCFFEAPLYFARTNFLWADEKIANLVDWQSARLKNNETLPEKTSFKIDPITGTVLQVDLSLMAVFKVVRQPFMRDLDKVQNLAYMPLFATNDKIALPFSLVWQVYYLQKFNDYHRPIMAGWALSGLGVMAFKFLR